MFKNSVLKIGMVLCLATLGRAQGAEVARPNVILIMTDDQGYGDLRSHGSPVIKTPAMDALRSEAVRFTDFHVAPKCTPTRGQLLTGVDAMRNGATRVCQGRSMVRAEFKMMPEYFADAGYSTGMFGKWHLGDSYPHRPRFRGFQEVVSFRAWGITSLADYWGNSYYDPVLMHNGIDKKYDGYCTDIFFREAMAWIKKCKDRKKPFFAYIPTNTPHVPNVVPEKYSKPYTGTYKGKKIPDTFYGMIANIDENLGKLEAFLKAQGLRDNTILIFMSDNGTQSGQAQQIFNAGMRDRKGSVIDGGHRVPLFVRWLDGRLRHGTDIAELATVQDLLPTLMDLCGLKGDDSALDGTSLAGLLKGTQAKMQERLVVSQIGFSCDPWNQAVVMNGKWRLIGGDKLYDIARDPHQDNNVIQAFPEVAKAMKSHYDKWYERARQSFEKQRYITIGSPQANPLILYASDWQGDYCDNRSGLTQGKGVGYWDLIVDRAGIYKLELRRWPKESGKSMTEGYRGPGDKGASARAIAAANVQIAGRNYTLDSDKEATHATFNVRLSAGKAKLATALMDADDLTLCSAMYVYVTRLDDGANLPLTPSSDRNPRGRAPSRKASVHRSAKPASAKVAAAITLAADDVLLTDFEGDSYGEWKTSGTAFGAKPTATRGRVVGHQGERLVDTFIANESDNPVGTLTSPAFKVERKYLNFLVGGGNHAGGTCVNLLVDGKTVRSVTGSAVKNAQQRKIMEWVSWDLSKWKAREARLVVVDDHTGSWGHIMIDHVFLSERPTTK